MTDDPRIAAARYRLRRDGGDDADESAADDAAPGEAPRVPGAQERAAYVETAIQQAIRRGDFDDLPGAGKPLEGLGSGHDPDWWIRRKIQSEKLTGLGPPALMLRTEGAELADRIDALRREDDVREYLEDFNRRVIEARRQLQGGPPVVTPTRDVEADVAAWRDRRDDRARAESAASAPPARRSRGLGPLRLRRRRRGV